MIITIPGTPIAKQRTGKTFYTPKNTRNYEKHIAACFLEQCPNQKPLIGPVYMGLTIMFAVPTSWSKKRKAALIEPDRNWHITPPDMSNVLKAIEDGLNGLAYEDDKQIALLRMGKFYTLNGQARCVVDIQPLIITGDTK